MFYSYNHFAVRLLNYYCFRLTISNCTTLADIVVVAHFGSMFPFVSPESIKHLCFSDVSKGYKNLTSTSTGFVLVAHRNYNVLQFFCFENYWLGKKTYISKTWNLKFRILNSKLIFRIFWFHNLGAIWWWWGDSLVTLTKN